MAADLSPLVGATTTALGGPLSAGLGSLFGGGQAGGGTSGLNDYGYSSQSSGGNIINVGSPLSNIGSLIQLLNQGAITNGGANFNNPSPFATTETIAETYSPNNNDIGKKNKDYGPLALAGVGIAVFLAIKFMK